jgi:hypothetical protein
MWIKVFHVAVTVVWLLEIITALNSECPNGLKEMPGTVDYHLQYRLRRGFWAALNHSPSMKFCNRHIARSVNLKL